MIIVEVGSYLSILVAIFDENGHYSSVYLFLCRPFFSDISPNLNFLSRVDVDFRCAICRRTQGVDGYAMIPTKDGQLVHYLCFKKVVKTAENHQFFDKGGAVFSKKFLCKFSTLCTVSEAVL